jgi:DtxR family Mn-dependent transcriptional regulator
MPLSGPVVVRRISEQLQKDQHLIHQLHEAGVEPGAAVTISRSGTAVELTRGGITVEIPAAMAGLVFVSAG